MSEERQPVDEDMRQRGLDMSGEQETRRQKDRRRADEDFAKHGYAVVGSVSGLVRPLPTKLPRPPRHGLPANP